MLLCFDLLNCVILFWCYVFSPLYYFICCYFVVALVNIYWSTFSLHICLFCLLLYCDIILYWFIDVFIVFSLFSWFVICYAIFIFVEFFCDILCDYFALYSFIGYVVCYSFDLLVLGFIRYLFLLVCTIVLFQNLMFYLLLIWIFKVFLNDFFSISPFL